MENLLLKKPVHSSSGKETAHFLTEAGERGWAGGEYPAYAQIDLKERCLLSRIVVETPRQGYTQYALYASLDGRDFKRIANRMEREPCPEGGDVFPVQAEARFLRILVKYYSEECKVYILNIKAFGEKLGEPAPRAPEPEVPAYADSKYAGTPTQEDTLHALEGIVERNLGLEYVDWFQFEVRESDKGNSFTLFQEKEKVHIAGDCGVSLAAGLNYYLKYYCGVLIAQVGSNARMPDAPPAVEAPVHRQTPFKLRYAYNYCTHSYTMAFWGEEEWQRELDWLALNGVNLVLDINAQEEVWRRFLKKLGYTHEEIKDYLVGPAYGAWAYMANMTGFGGPLHDSWFACRTELARKNQFFMRAMGMSPVLQGYSGMVPRNIREKQPGVRIIPQGLWNNFERPAMLRTNTKDYHRFASLFYEAQREVYGDASRYFATDPFHEGGRRGGLSPRQVGRHVMRALQRENPANVWVIQSWGENPSRGLLKGLKKHKENALILDLYAEKRPRWEHWRGKEFQHTPWLYCMLNNFGGRMGLHGHMETIAGEVARAWNASSCMRGIGITPEASRSNPVLFDLFFETAWGEEGKPLAPVMLDHWLPGYTRRRYGAQSPSCAQAMELLRQTVYNPALNMKGEGAPESVINARPAWTIQAASTWGNAVIGYDKRQLERALQLFLDAYGALEENPGYRYDLADCMKQVLSNAAQDYHMGMAGAFQEKKKDLFERYSAGFLRCVDLAERVLSQIPDFRLESWLGQARRLAEGTDDFTKDLFQFNAKALITTWGSRPQADGGLRDYSNRQWAGLTSGFYRPRWVRFIENAKKELDGAPHREEDWFAMEWQWVWAKSESAASQNPEDLRALGEEVLRLCSEIPASSGQ